MLTSGTASIAADNHSHVKYFPDVKAYDDYYDIIVDIGEVGVESFADRVQELLVDYLRATYGDALRRGTHSRLCNGAQRAVNGPATGLRTCRR